MTRALLACSLPLVVFLGFLLLVGVAFWWIRRHGQERRALWHSLATPAARSAASQPWRSFG